MTQLLRLLLSPQASMSPATPMGRMAQLKQKPTCKATGFCQEECAPGHQEEECGLQQREAVKLGELSHVRLYQGTVSTKYQGAK